MSVQTAKKKTALRVAASRGDIERPYLEACARVLEESGGAPDWLRNMRRRGVETFKSQGFPHRRLEAWKYTDLRPRMRAEYHMPCRQETTGYVANTAFDGVRSYRLVVIDGVFEPALSTLPQQNGLELVTLGAAAGALPQWAQDLLGQEVLFSGPMPALAAALMRDGLFIRLAPGVAIDRPLHIIFQTSSGAAQVHTVLGIVLEKDAHATLVESYVSRNRQASFHNQVTALKLAEGAQLSHIRLEESTPENLHITTLGARQAKNARYTAMSVVSGGALVRHEADIRLEDAGASTEMRGVYMLAGRQHCDSTIVVDHKARDCTSRQVYQGVLTENSRGVYQGKVIVEEGAGGTDAHQLSRALLLSARAEADTKPELEIYADDVKCSHGATIGALDSEALFYLRSRGIPLGQAKSLLIEAFLDEVVEGAVPGVLSAPLRNHITQWLLGHEAEISQEGSGA